VDLRGGKLAGRLVSGDGVAVLLKWMKSSRNGGRVSLSSRSLSATTALATRSDVSGVLLSISQIIEGMLEDLGGIAGALCSFGAAMACVAV
jgi:hypothetical protein